jgi:hypothetical protein
LFTGLVTFPIAPVRGVLWVAERMLDQANTELNDPATIYQRLDEIDEARASGELSAQESAEAEAQLMDQLMRTYGRGGPAGDRPGHRRPYGTGRHAGISGEWKGSNMAQRYNPEAADDDQAPRGEPGSGTGDSPAAAQGPGTHSPEDPGHPMQRPLSSMEAARRATDAVHELTRREPEHVISVAKQNDSWHVGLEVVELQRLPDSADIVAVYEVTLDTRGELVTCRRERRYVRGSAEEWR